MTHTVFKRDVLKQLPISLAYAVSATQQWYLELQVAPHSTVLDALNRSGWLDIDDQLRQWCEQHRHATTIDQTAWRVGIYAKKCVLNEPLKPFDRVEVYRPLKLDPMLQRKNKSL